jgi:isopropylmalate/homocitrate/citramalate synthase
VLSTFSDLHIKYKLGKTLLKREGKPVEKWLDTKLNFYHQANTNMVCDVIKYAREKGISRIEFASEDSSRGNIKYGVEWAKACVKAGGTRMCFSDTCGVFTPEAVDFYVPKMLKALDGVPMTAHFHNDFGMGAFNTVRAMSHGATYAGITANGIGERAGNTSLHLTVMILKELYGVDIPGFKYDKLVELRKMVERYSGVPIQAHEPIIGEGVFAHESGIHTAGILINPLIYQFIREETVGGTHKFIFGKHSGAAAVESVLEKNKERLKSENIEINDELIQKLLEKIKDLREEMIKPEEYIKYIEEYYKNYQSLGISEEELIEIAINLDRG